MRQLQKKKQKTFTILDKMFSNYLVLFQTVFLVPVSEEKAARVWASKGRKFCTSIYQDKAVKSRPTPK